MILQKKICLLGAEGVGKTSLVTRFVEHSFSPRYLQTIGVSVSKQTVCVGDDKLDMILWDLAGTEQFNFLSQAYLRGAAGYVLVLDGVREDTWETALRLQNAARQLMKIELPFVVAVNKVDLESKWCDRAREYRDLQRRGWSIFRTSARTGEGVQEAFEDLARRILEGSYSKTG